ncbi:MAG TPA: TenA family protein [Candidatus Limnocylindria bacterium]
MTPGLARTLWQESAPLARRALTHPFVVRLAQGTLPRERFAGYIAQDAYFLESFARAYAAAAARSPDRDGLLSFTRLLNGVVDELELHGSYAERWGIDLDRVRPLPSTTAYTDFLAEAARSGVARTCAAMTPCMRLYADLGQELARTARREDHPYGEWIATYSSDGFEALTAQLERLLDRYASPGADVRAAYRRAMELELAFFDAHSPVEVPA